MDYSEDFYFPWQDFFYPSEYEESLNNERRILDQTRLSQQSAQSNELTLNMLSAFIIDFVLISVGIAGLFMDKKRIAILKNSQEKDLIKLSNDSSVSCDSKHG